MKNLFFAIALLFAAFFNACQENSITGPINTQNAEKNSAYYTNTGHIRLNQQLTDPRQGSLTSLDIIGSIDYAVSPIKDPQNDIAFNAVAKIKINAIITNPQAYTIDKPSNYTVFKETEDYFDLSQFGARTVTLVKKYELTGCREMRLMCTYQVSKSAVTLSRIALCCEGQVTILPIQY